MSNANADASSIADQNKMGKTSFFAFALVVAFRTCKNRGNANESTKER